MISHFIIGHVILRPVRPLIEVRLTLTFGVFGKSKIEYFDFIFDFTQWKPTDTWPRDRCGRAQLVLLPSLAGSLRLGADLYQALKGGYFVFLWRVGT